MSDAIKKRLFALQGQMETMRSPWEGMWKEINELILPRKSDVGTGSPGIYRERRRYDSTGMNGNERLATSIVGYMTPQVLDWFELNLPMPGGKTNPRVEAWAQQVAQKMHEAIQQSNFASEFEESLLDLGAPGTGTLFVDKAPNKNGRFGGLAHQSWAIGEYWITEGPDGLVNRVHRQSEFTAEQMAEKFGLENLHEKTQTFIKEEKPFAKAMVLQAIWKKADGESLSTKTDKFPIANVFLDMTNKHILSIGGFYEFPVVVGRWRKASGETWGRGPGMTALPDVQVLNEADKLGLQAWSNQILPPILQLHEGVIGKPDLRSRRINTITEKGALDFLVAPSDINVDMIRRQEKQASVREIFFMDQINFIPDRGKTPPTATEVQARLNMMLQILGPTLHRIEWEMLMPYINRVFQILWRAGEIPEPPQEVLELAKQTGGRLIITFTGPIARARRQADGAAIDNFLQRVSVVGQIDPNVMDIINTEEIVRQVAKLEGVKQSVFRTLDEIEQKQKARQQELAQQQQLMNAKLAGDAAKSITQAQAVGAGEEGMV